MDIFKGIMLAISYMLMGIMVVFLLVTVSNAEEYDVYGRHGHGLTDYDVRTDNNQDYTINERMGGREVGTFTIPPQPNPPEMQMGWKEGSDQTVHLPSLSNILK